MTGVQTCALPIFWAKSSDNHLRSIFRRIFVSVHEAYNGLNEAWGPDARDLPGYREALIEVAVALNAAQSAYDIRQDVERAGKGEIEVLFSVYDTGNHRVTMPFAGTGPAPEVQDGRSIRLAYAPTHPREFSTLASQIARSLRPGATPEAAPATA